jgi:hypothetical protein
VQFTVQLPIPIVFVPTVRKLVGNGGCRALLPFKDVCADYFLGRSMRLNNCLAMAFTTCIGSFQSTPRHKQCRRQSTG